jgi:hypothetical protein
MIGIQLGQQIGHGRRSCGNAPIVPEDEAAV